MTIKNQPSSLKGIKVLDLSRILAGPWATQILADLGAEVIKIESKNGDDTRIWGPPFLSNEDGIESDATYFASCNRNKKSIIIDFSKKDGANLIKNLAKKADVIVENFKFGGLKKYGLDYETIKHINKKIIYCSITGFGQTGPYSERAGYDFLIQGMAGLMSITGQNSLTNNSEPTKVGVAVSDLFSGMYLSTSILAALIYRKKSGEGQFLDCSLFDCQVSMLANQSSNWLNGKMLPTRIGNHHPNVVPYSVYEVKDGHIIIACGNDRQFKSFTKSIGISKIAYNKNYSTNAQRVKNREKLNKILSTYLIKFTKTNIIKLLEIAKVPCGPINNIKEVFEDPQTNYRNLKVSMDRSDKTKIHTTAFPIKFSKTPPNYSSPPPILGADTKTILKSWLNINEKDLEHLKNLKII